MRIACRTVAISGWRALAAAASVTIARSDSSKRRAFSGVGHCAVNATSTASCSCAERVVEASDGGVLLRHAAQSMRRAVRAAGRRISRPPAEERERRPGALAHHGFEGRARHVDELARFGCAEMTLDAIGHACGRAVEIA